MPSRVQDGVKEGVGMEEIAKLRSWLPGLFGHLTPDTPIHSSLFFQQLSYPPGRKLTWRGYDLCKCPGVCAEKGLVLGLMLYCCYLEILENF